jgi:hypothetical protein
VNALSVEEYRDAGFKVDNNRLKIIKSKEKEFQGKHASIVAREALHKYIREKRQGLPNLVPPNLSTGTELQRLQLELFELVCSFLQDNSYEAAARSLKIKSSLQDNPIEVPVRYLEDSVAQLLRVFNQVHEEKKGDKQKYISRSHFERLMPEYYRNACKESDFCDVCQQGKQHQEKLNKNKQEIDVSIISINSIITR